MSEVLFSACFEKYLKTVGQSNEIDDIFLNWQIIRWLLVLAATTVIQVFLQQIERNNDKIAPKIRWIAFRLIERELKEFTGWE